MVRNMWSSFSQLMLRMILGRALQHTNCAAIPTLEAAHFSIWPWVPIILSIFYSEGRESKPAQTSTSPKPGWKKIVIPSHPVIKTICQTLPDANCKPAPVTLCKETSPYNGKQSMPLYSQPVYHAGNWLSFCLITRSQPLRDWYRSDSIK